MHYIRILKPPRLIPASPPFSLSAKITITTDLGESFLSSNIPIFVELEFEDGTSVLGERKGRDFLWRGRDGMRSLEVVVPLLLSRGKRKLGGEMVRMLIRPKEDRLAVDSFLKVLDNQGENHDSVNEGGVVPVRSMAIDISPGAMAKAPGVGMAERVFSRGSLSKEKRVRIWEETGESIARHIWDAGLVLSSYLSVLSTAESSASSRTFPSLPILEQALRRKNRTVLELGAGCGIVGISLATFFPIQQVLLTDLPEASEILAKNLSPAILPLPTRSKVTTRVLDWASPLPPSIASTTWDIVLVADCTYNPDVVPDLVATLKSLAEGNENVVVLLAMKVRHESEMAFFDLVRDGGFVVREKCKIPLPVLGGEDEEIEIFLFGFGA